jgi:hypothetical protein
VRKRSPPLYRDVESGNRSRTLSELRQVRCRICLLLGRNGKETPASMNAVTPCRHVTAAAIRRVGARPLYGGLEGFIGVDNCARSVKDEKKNEKSGLRQFRRRRLAPLDSCSACGLRKRKSRCARGDLRSARLIGKGASPVLHGSRHPTAASFETKGTDVGRAAVASEKRPRTRRSSGLRRSRASSRFSQLTLGRAVAASAKRRERRSRGIRRTWEESPSDS